jgi:hypothetical protein
MSLSVLSSRDFTSSVTGQRMLYVYTKVDCPCGRSFYCDFPIPIKRVVIVKCVSCHRELYTWNKKEIT